jgi:hypothetical protein
MAKKKSKKDSEKQRGLSGWELVKQSEGDGITERRMPKLSEVFVVREASKQKSVMFSQLSPQQKDDLTAHSGKIGVSAWEFSKSSDGALHAQLDPSNPKATAAFHDGEIEADHLIWDNAVRGDVRGEWVPAEKYSIPLGKARGFRV